jgi:hypothetical protein
MGHGPCGAGTPVLQIIIVMLLFGSTREVTTFTDLPQMASRYPNHVERSFGLYACRPNGISPLCNVRVPLKTDSKSRWG